MDISDLTDVLRRRLTEARTTKNNSMLLVAGSGVSVQATKRAPAASWGGLLRSGLELCKQQTSDRKKKIDAAAVETMLAAKKVSAWINAATVIERTLRGDGGTVYEDWLSETVGALRPTQPEVLRAIAELGIPVATTNYDGLLEHELESQPITWRTHGLVDLFLGGTYPGILHLHGHFAEPQSVVLGASSYDKIATDPRAQDTMRHLLRNRDLIFVGVGAGLEDPNFGALLNWAKDVTLPDARYHFLLVRQEDARELRAKLPLTLRIHVIVYGQDHEHLAPFLRNLIGPAQAASQPSESERFSVSGSTSVDTSRPVLAAAQMEIGLQALQRLFHDWAPSVADRLVEAATALRATSSDNATEYRRVLASLDEIVHDVLNISFFTAVQRASEGAPEPRYLARPPSPGAMPFGSTNESVLWPRRDDLVKEVNRLLAKRQLLFVTGPSSSGKTSLILGVLKENTRYANFTYCSLRDGDPEHLVKELPVGTQAPLLVIDHVEELFSPARPVTASSTTDPRQTLCAALFGGAEPLSKKSIVILIIREDRLRELAQVEGLSTNMSATIRVPMLSSKELKEMLQHQLRNAQLKAEEGLLDRLEIDLDDAPGRMCLAQRSLVRLYQHRRGYRLRLSEYQEFARPSTLLLDLANEFLADCQVAERQYVRYVGSSPYRMGSRQGRIEVEASEVE